MDVLEKIQKISGNTYFADNQKSGLFAGVDEAGRGPLAGRVYAAAVILDYNRLPPGIKDSKKLTASTRSVLFNEIKAQSVDWAIAYSSVKEIDEINILQATLLAMKRAILQLLVVPQHIFIDGTHNPDVNYPMTCLVKGDEKLDCISAASILAKHARDEYMMDCDKKYPVYQFAKHKGYPTKEHIQALSEFGPCEFHRKTFKPVRNFLNTQ